jgi:hypothetical protein
MVGVFWKAARIGACVWGAGALSGRWLTGPDGTAAGERLSPWVAASCVAMGLTILFLS